MTSALTLALRIEWYAPKLSIERLMESKVWSFRYRCERVD
jgi:hypothetical protein